MSLVAGRVALSPVFICVHTVNGPRNLQGSRDPAGKDVPSKPRGML